MQQPKLDKALLNRIASHAKTIFKDRGYSDGTRYLEPGEIIARAHAEAFIAELTRQGYVIVKK